MNSLKGSLLVASPELADPNFRQSVVLVVQHGDEGALGLVLNRPTQMTVQQVVAQATGGKCPCTERIYIGGPCEGPLMALHNRSEAGEIEVLPGVYFSGAPENLRPIVELARQPLRMFGGYAGWSAGQLEAELDEQAWRVAPATARHVFGSEEGLWERLTSSLEVLSLLGIASLPPDPSLN